MDFKAELVNFEQLNKVFTNLPRSMQRKVYTKALRAGAAPVRDAASANIASVSKPYTGLLSRKGTVRIYSLKKYRGNFRVGVQVRRGLLNTKIKDKDGNPIRVGLYASVLEYGSQKLNRAPRSWARKAIRENKDQAISNVAEEVSKRLIEALADAKR